MAIETCENCKRIIGELEQAYTWQSHILCKECYHAPVILSSIQKILVKSKLIIMVTVIPVIVVISIVLSISSKQSSYDKQHAHVTTTKTNLKMLHHAVAQFKMDTGRYPTQEEGLSVLIEPPSDVKGYQTGGYLDSTDIPRDTWGKSGTPLLISSK